MGLYFIKHKKKPVIIAEFGNSIYFGGKMVNVGFEHKKPKSKPPTELLQIHYLKTEGIWLHDFTKRRPYTKTQSQVKKGISQKSNQEAKTNADWMLPSPCFTLGILFGVLNRILFFIFLDRVLIDLFCDFSDRFL